MKTYESTCIPGPAVTFPEWRGERHYMLPFTKTGPLPSCIGRYADTIRAMMGTVEVAPDRECYIMIDESEVAPGATQRRPGIHVDGYWHASPAKCHGPAPSHRPVSPPYRGHQPVPSHGPLPGHRPLHSGSSSHSEAILLASNYSACRAYAGQYSKDFESSWAGGDCSDLDVSRLDPMQLEAFRIYRLNVFSVHESLPVTQAVRRTLVRVNAPLN